MKDESIRLGVCESRDRIHLGLPLGNIALLFTILGDFGFALLISSMGSIATGNRKHEDTKSSPKVKHESP